MCHYFLDIKYMDSIMTIWMKNNSKIMPLKQQEKSMNNSKVTLTRNPLFCPSNGGLTELFKEPGL